MPLSLDEVGPDCVAVVGVPLDENSSFLRGAALAPARIREALRAGSSNLEAEDGFDLGPRNGWADVGDLDLGSGESAFDAITAGIGELLDRGSQVLALGGDHSVTYPILRAFGARVPGLQVLHLDAHPDLYDELDGNRRSHACPFARTLEAGLVSRLVQVGIRTSNRHQREQASRFGVETITMRDWPVPLPSFDGPVYLSLDLDVLDPAFAPGVSHHEPGGLTTREVLTLIQGLDAPLVGADIVELNPHRDPVGLTAVVAAKLLKEIVAVMRRSA